MIGYFSNVTLRISVEGTEVLVKLKSLSQMRGEDVRGWTPIKFAKLSQDFHAPIACKHFSYSELNHRNKLRLLHIKEIYLRDKIIHLVLADYLNYQVLLLMSCNNRRKRENCS